MSGDCFVGVMSGTSLDGVDAVVALFDRADGRRFRTLGVGSLPFPDPLRDELIALHASGPDEIARACRVANALADLYAEAIAAALSAAALGAAAVTAAGVHGQTIRHRPDLGWTVQINNPARVAEKSGVAIVADFRSRDVAAGGQGAPLVPAFHAALFGGARHRAIVNVGGIANVSDLPPGGIVRGFDIGPGNVLMDLWHARHRGGRFDVGGAWAASGRVNDTLLADLLAEPFFALAPPRSTGRDLFNARWLEARVAGRGVPMADVQATLLALTARSIADALARHCPGVDEVLVCGGGAHNDALLAALRALLPQCAIATTAVAGVAPRDVEALAFAWLAREALAGRPGNLPAVTGARGPRVLGAIYPR
jgi:anhydro-N-acetylmuramic acid kinase